MKDLVAGVGEAPCKLIPLRGKPIEELVSARVPRGDSDSMISWLSETTIFVEVSVLPPACSPSHDGRASPRDAFGCPDS